MSRVLDFFVTRFRRLSSRNYEGESWLLIKLHSFLRHRIPEGCRYRLSNNLIRLWVANSPRNAAAHAASWSGERILGVDVIGLLRSGLGISENALAILRALSLLKIKTRQFDFYKHLYTPRMESEVAAFRDRPLRDRHPIALIHATGGALPRIYLELGSEYFQYHYTIAYWAWETARIPREWLLNQGFIDEIWTPSEFCRQIFQEEIAKPITVIPPSIELGLREQADRRDYGLPEQDFLFLCLVDFLSLAERKNPQGALDAYLRAFTGQDRGVRFVLKSRNMHVAPDFQREFAALQEQHASILHLDYDMDRIGVNSLIQQCDCLVSLHRSEGFGMPIAEAMSLGKPVIATGWSGNMDFMNVENSLPVDYELARVPHDLGPYRRGDIWAEPDLDHAAALMSKVVAERDFATRLGRRAEIDIRAQYGIAPVADRIRERLIELGFVLQGE